MGMRSARNLQPEWLDVLPAADPGAVGSRADLALLNRLMLQAEILHRILVRNCRQRQPLEILDLGAGDGTFMLRLARKLSCRWPKVSVTLLDRQNLVGRETLEAVAAEGWRATTVEADALAFLDAAATAKVDIITANLFLHHFAEPELLRIFQGAARLARLFVACEPRRNRFALGCSRALWVIGCNHVTRHDAPASVRAGFSGKELSAVWPEEGWRLSEYAAGPFAHCFVARNTSHG